MSKILKSQFNNDWITPWQGTTKYINISDIKIAREILNYLNFSIDMNLKKMYTSKKPCIGIIRNSFTNWPFGHRDECCKIANEKFYSDLKSSIDDYDNFIDVCKFSSYEF
jgi:hypothetical protein